MIQPDHAISEAELAALRDGCAAIARRDGVIRVEGAGAETCLQGILTNDLVRGSPSLVWGAVLTPKGMIITDLWVRRDDTGFWLVVPAAGREALLAVLARSFPPRLARVTDRSDSLAVWWLAGELPSQVAGLDLAIPSGPAPFAAMALVERGDGPRLLERVGCTVADEAVGDVLRALRGWPALGHEIDEKTLPQEVRFDELEGVKYDKGCYVGQETVARLHFRGHANRLMRALPGSGDLPEDPTITNADGKEVGTVATLIRIGPQWVATARIRREVAVGDPVTVGGRPSRVSDFPIEPVSTGG